MTLRLAGMALDHWAEFDGYAVSRNMPLLTELPVQRFANFVTWYATREAEPKEVAKFRNQLWRPPPNNTAPIPASSPWSPEAETSAFRALKQQLKA